MFVDSLQVLKQHVTVACTCMQHYDLQCSHAVDILTFVECKEEPRENAMDGRQSVLWL